MPKQNPVQTLLKMLEAQAEFADMQALLQMGNVRGSEFKPTSE